VRHIRRKLDQRGATAIEVAIVLPVLLLLVFGMIDFARAIWVQTTLARAAQSAARCAAVDEVKCGTVADIQSYAVGAAPALDIAPEDFSVSLAPCGRMVSVSVSFEFILPLVYLDSIDLGATACYPV
jgi:hypothetical protein